MEEQIIYLPRVVVQGGAVAFAKIRGSAAYPRIQGDVFFYPFEEGSMVLASINGLPPNRFLGFHVHEGGSCETPKGAPDFQSAGSHYNPSGEVHPNHAGDLPVLLSAGDGFAYMLVYTSRFKPQDVLGRTVIVHAMPDNFRSQPAGDSGSRIACGVIEKTTPAPQ